MKSIGELNIKKRNKKKKRKFTETFYCNTENKKMGLLSNKNMQKVWAALPLAALASLGLGASARALEIPKYGPIEFDNIEDLAERNKYLKLLIDKQDSDNLLRVTAPEPKVKQTILNKADKQLKDDLLAEDEGRQIPYSLLALSKQNKNAAENPVWETIAGRTGKAWNIDDVFGNITNPITGELKDLNPAEVPAFWSLIAGAVGLPMTLGYSFADKYIKNKRDESLADIKYKAKRDYEKALLYEREAAQKRKNKQASEDNELIQAIEEYYDERERTETLLHNTKTAVPNLATMLTTLGLPLAIASAIVTGTAAHHRSKERTEAAAARHYLDGNIDTPEKAEKRVTERAIESLTQ